MPRMDRIGTYQTQVYESYNTIGVVLFKTKILEINTTTGEVELNTGGWFTATTKNRMNQACNVYQLPFRVYQKRGSWYVDVVRDTGITTMAFDKNILRFNYRVESEV